MKRMKLWLAVGAGGILLVILLAAAQERSVQASRPAPSGFEVGIPTAQEVRAMLGAYGARVEENEKALGDLRSELAATRDQLAASMQALSQERQRDVGSLAELLKGSKAEPAIEPGRFRVFDFAPPPASKKALHLPAGSFGEATLLTGVFAPTSGEPLPVLVRLDTALLGPQRTRIPIRDAFLIGKAAGDANSKRAVVQVSTLSLVGADGRSIEVNVNGWVVDDDGVQGLRGDYVWRADEIVALASLAGGLSAAADAFSARESTTSVTPLGGAIGAVTGDPVKFAGFRAMGETAKRFGEAVSSRLNEITPAIHVANGKKVTVAFISGVTLDGMEVDDAVDAPHPYRGLDGRR